VAVEKELPIFPSAESKFFMITWGETEIEFLRDRNGQVTAFEMRQNGKVDRAERISDGPPA